MTAEEPSRVLFLVSEYDIPTNPLGGIFFRDLALALHARGNRVDIVYVEPRSLRELTFDAIRESHFQVVAKDEDGILTVRQRGWNPMIRSTVGARAWRRLTERLTRRYLRAYGRPDLIHAHNTVWAGCIAHEVHRQTGLPYVITEHSSLFLMGQTPAAERALIGEALADADDVLAVSTALARSMRPYLTGREVTVVPNMVDLAWFTEGPPKTASPYVFLAVAHLNKNKGFDVLIRAFATAFERDAGTRLLIGGDGPELEALRRLASELGLGAAVEFLGYLTRSEVRDAMHRAHTLVHPSFAETFGIVLIEALATGIPVIATRCGGPEEIVTEGLGALVEPGNVGQLASAMKEMRATRRYLPGELRENVSRRFGAEGVASKVESVYRSVLTRTARRRG